MKNLTGIDDGIERPVQYFIALVDSVDEISKRIGIKRISGPRKETIDNCNAALRIMNGTAYDKWVTKDALISWTNPDTGKRVDVMEFYKIDGFFNVFIKLGCFEEKKIKKERYYRSIKEFTTEIDGERVARLKNIIHNYDNYAKQIRIFNLEYEQLQKEPVVTESPKVEETKAETNVNETSNNEEYVMGQMSLADKDFSTKVQNLANLAEEIRNQNDRTEQLKNEIQLLLTSPKADELIQAKRTFDKYAEYLNTSTNK